MIAMMMRKMRKGGCLSALEVLGGWRVGQMHSCAVLASRCFVCADLLLFELLLELLVGLLLKLVLFLELLFLFVMLLLEFLLLLLLLAKGGCKVNLILLVVLGVVVVFLFNRTQGGRKSNEYWSLMSGWITCIAC